MIKYENNSRKSPIVVERKIIVVHKVEDNYCMSNEIYSAVKGSGNPKDTVTFRPGFMC